MDIAWIQDVIRSKTQGLPFDSEPLFISRMGLCLGDKLFTSPCIGNMFSPEAPEFPISRPSYLLLQALCQSGAGELFVAASSEYHAMLESTIASLPDSMTGIRQIRNHFPETDLILALSESLGSYSLSGQHQKIPGIQADWYGAMVLLSLYVPGGSSEKSYGKNTVAELLHALVGSDDVQPWQALLGEQLAMFLTVAYATRRIGQAGEFPWLLIDMEDNRICRHQEDIEACLEKIKHNQSVASEDCRWIPLYSA